MSAPVWDLNIPLDFCFTFRFLMDLSETLFSEGTSRSKMNLNTYSLSFVKLFSMAIIFWYRLSVHVVCKFSNLLKINICGRSSPTILFFFSYCLHLNYLDNLKDHVWYPILLNKSVPVKYELKIFMIRNIHIKVRRSLMIRI